MDRSPVRRDYTDIDLQNARTKGQLVGWVQGGLGTIAALFVLQFVGWIPALVVLGVLGFVALKLFGSKK